MNIKLVILGTAAFIVVVGGGIYWYTHKNAVVAVPATVSNSTSPEGLALKTYTFPATGLSFSIPSVISVVQTLGKPPITFSGYAPISPVRSAVFTFQTQDGSIYGRLRVNNDAPEGDAGPGTKIATTSAVVAGMQVTESIITDGGSSGISIFFSRAGDGYSLSLPYTSTGERRVADAIIASMRLADPVPPHPAVDFDTSETLNGVAGDALVVSGSAYDLPYLRVTLATFPDRENKSRVLYDSGIVAASSKWSVTIPGTATGANVSPQGYNTYSLDVRGYTNATESAVDTIGILAHNAVTITP